MNMLDYDYAYTYGYAEELRKAESYRRARLISGRPSNSWRRRIARLLFALSCRLDSESYREQVWAPETSPG